MAVALIASIVFGTMPAWQATSIGDVVTRIREEGGSTTSDPKRQRMRSLLIVAETTLAVVLLVGAGLLARSFDRLLSVDLGFSRRCRTDLQRVAANREVQSTAAAAAVRRDAVGAHGGESERRIGRRHLRVAALEFPLRHFHVHSRRRHASRTMSRMQLTLQVRIVTPDYFKTMGIPVVKGRAFTAGDRLGSELVAMLNADRRRAACGPIRTRWAITSRSARASAMGGARAGGARGRHRRRCARLRSGRRPCPPTLYLPHAQWPVGEVTIVAKARNGDPSSLVQPMRALLQDLDPDVPMFAVRSMEQIVGDAVAQPRLYLVLIASLRRRRRCCWRRSASTACSPTRWDSARARSAFASRSARKRGEVLRMVMTQAGTLAVAGVAIGLGAAVIASRALRAQLFRDRADRHPRPMRWSARAC